MTETAPTAPTTSPPPSRRSVLGLLGAGALAPAAAGLLSAGPPGTVVDGDGLRFTVLGAHRRVLAGHGGPGRHTAEASWPDVVRVRLRLLNVAATALLVSPGQFRLRVGEQLTVMPTAWAHEPGPLGAGGRRVTWIDYRAPASTLLLGLEFTAAGRSRPVEVPLVTLFGDAS